MKFPLLPLLLILSIASPAQDARQLIRETLEAYGGNSWSRVNGVKMHTYGHYHWLEQSESPTGPQLTSYEDTEEVHGTKDRLLYKKSTQRHFQANEPSTMTVVVNGDKGSVRFGERPAMPFRPYSGMMDRQKAWLLFCPDRLLNLLASAEVTYGGERHFLGVRHQVVQFTSPQGNGSVSINANTRLISEASFEIAFPREYFFSIWGTLTARVQYTLYGLYPGNRYFPHQWDIWLNDQFYSQTTVADITFLDSLDTNQFTLEDALVSNYPSDPRLSEKKINVNLLKDVAPGIQLLPDSWNTSWVVQDKGVVVLEAPISSWHSKQVINEIRTRYPSKPILGVIVTSDAWPHLGGAREYMAEKIPVYTIALNLPILNKVAQADYSGNPDSFQSRRQRPSFRPITDPITLDDADRPLTIYPVNGEGGERMVAVYFPKQKILYASDLIQMLNRKTKTFFFPEYLMEVKKLVDRHHLDVETVYAMHTEPLPWSDVREALDKLK